MWTHNTLTAKAVANLLNSVTQSGKERWFKDGNHVAMLYLLFA